MVARSSAAPPTPWSKSLAEPQIAESAYVHSFANLVGHVTVGPNVIIAPGTSIRADEGTPFIIGADTYIQDGVVIHGLEVGSVLGDDDQEYSIWIGQRVCLTHLALIHGPAYLGDDCFIGFRSTVFNARIGAGSVVMMHALIQDVEIPPGKYVPSGSVITSQHQADRLPDVTASDRAFALHIFKMNEAIRLDYPQAHTPGETAAIAQEALSQTPGAELGSSSEQSVGIMSLNGDLVGQVRSLLAQGYAVGTEYADARRFKTKSWTSGPVLQGQRPDQVLAELDRVCADNPKAYVRIVGVDPQRKQRVLEAIIQRPGDAAPQQKQSSRTATIKPPTTTAGNGGRVAIGGDASQQVRSLLAQGYKIGTEHADKRRFKTKSWTSCRPIDSRNEAEVMRQLQTCMTDHAGEYVRLIGIDPQQKRRVVETIIQRPEDAPGGAAASPRKTATATVAAGAVDGDLSQQVRSLLNQGCKIGVEHADARRFKTKSWTTCPAIEARSEGEVLRQLQAYMADFAGEYVRLVGIDPQQKRRVVEVIVQRPQGNTTVKAAASTATASAPVSGGGSVAAGLDSETIQQVRSLLAQGYKIGTEHADKRRFKTKSWTSCNPIDSRSEAEVLRLIAGCMADHAGEYVRLIGIDAQQKRRVLETIIQRP